MSNNTATKTGYCNGSDILLYIEGKAVGHCETHTTTVNSKTKERAVKPVASAPIGAGLWSEKSVVGLDVSISFDGLVFYQETETGYKGILGKQLKGQTVEAKCMERGDDSQPYLVGNFVVDTLERTDQANEDSKYKGTLSNSGPVTYNEDAITETAPAA